jgi:hypothetical protein
MRALKFWEEKTEVFIDDDDDGNTERKKQWFCSDGVSTFFGDTKSEAASHFGVPVGDFGDVTAAASTLGKKGGKSKSERKAAASRENGRKGGRPKKESGK